MSYIEKINIYVPEYLSNLMNDDAKLFEIYKKDKKTINRNKYLNMVLAGYHNEFVFHNNRIFDSVLSSINNLGISLDISRKAARDIVEEIVSPPVNKRKGVRLEKLSLKPTKDTVVLITQAIKETGNDDGVSKYFRKMLLSYSEKPLHERERIVFRDNYDLLIRACEKQQPLMFSTIWNPDSIHVVVPYKVAVGKEEMFNYLLCGEMNKSNGRQEARSYRLNRIGKIMTSDEEMDLKNSVEKHLNDMLYYAPQFAINDDEEYCVKMNAEGETLFNRIYYGRPKEYKIERKGEEAFYYFKCSEDQVFLYFRRFAGDVAEVVASNELRERMRKSFEDNLKVYNV